MNLMIKFGIYADIFSPCKPNEDFEGSWRIVELCLF